MEMFTMRDGHLVLDKQEETKDSIPALTLDDCLVYKHDMAIGSHFIHPGTIVYQKNGIIHGHKINGVEVFAYVCDDHVHQFKIDDNKLFAINDEGKGYIFDKSTTEPHTFHLSRRPLGWYIIPETDYIISWNILSLSVNDISGKTTTLLKGHTKRVTCATGNASTLITADQAGHICIWYISSWTCFHDIVTGTNSIKDIIADDTRTAALLDEKVVLVDIVTGRVISEWQGEARAICFTSKGLVLAKDNTIELIKDNKVMAIIEHKTSRLMHSFEERFWAIANRNIVEIQLDEHCMGWQRECVEWVKSPIFPFDKTWSSNRFMDVLALSTDEWMPKMNFWKPPIDWFRYPPLRDAMWTTCLQKKLRISYEWPYLGRHIVKIWHDKCWSYVLEQIKDFEWDPFIVHLLDHIRHERRLVHPLVRKWCWFHHGRIELRPVLMQICENDTDGTFLKTIMDEKSPDAILCVSEAAIHNWLDLGFVCVFIRWLKQFHNEYHVGPIEHLPKMYTMIAQDCFKKLKSNTMDIPLEESGTWTTKDKLMPNDKDAYIKQNSRKGFVTSVAIQPNGDRLCKWQPIHRTREIPLIGSVQIWTPTYKEGPNTILECALELLQDSQWRSYEEKVSWKWFRSEIGAFICTGMNIFLYEKHMRIRKATWTNRGGHILTTENAAIEEHEHGPLECEIDSWSYIDDNLCYLTPLRLKICSLMSLSPRKNIVADHYISDVLACCNSSSIQREQIWRSKKTVSSIVSSSGHFVVGFSDGSIHEYESITSFEKKIRSFMAHEIPVRCLHIMSNMLLSLSQKKVCVFCLGSGSVLMTYTSRLLIEHAVPVSATHAWMIERTFRRTDSHPVCTLWDIRNQIPLRTLPTPTIEYPARDIITCHNAMLMGFDTTMIFWTPDDRHQMYDIDVSSSISCFIKTSNGIRGGTTNGTLFSVEYEKEDISRYNVHTWPTPFDAKITTIAEILDSTYILLGTDTGHIILWNTKASDSFITKKLTSRPIRHIYIQNMFAMISFGSTVECMSVVPERALLSCHTLTYLMNWSFAWRCRIFDQVERTVIPCVISCLENEAAWQPAFILAEMCTSDYNDRAHWCTTRMFDALIRCDSCLAKTILERLVTFRGPRLTCMICSDEDPNEPISYLKTCHHRFHTSCLEELVEKQPEYHDELQYEYALSFELKCPTCRETFKPTDICPDVFLNDNIIQHVHK